MSQGGLDIRCRALSARLDCPHSLQPAQAEREWRESAGLWRQQSLHCEFVGGVSDRGVRAVDVEEDVNLRAVVELSKVIR